MWDGGIIGLALKAHIAKVEGLVTPGHRLYKDMKLFQDMNSDAAMSDTDVISFQDDTYPGSDEGDPIALVNAITNTAVDLHQINFSVNIH